MLAPGSTQSCLHGTSCSQFREACFAMTRDEIRVLPRPTLGANAKKAARRGLSEEHVHANLKACEQTVQSFMDKHAHREPGGGTVMQMTLGETSNTASDVRDRLVDFLDKTVGRL